MHDQVAAEYGHTVEGALVTDVRGAVLVLDDVPDLELFLRAQAQGLGVRGLGVGAVGVLDGRDLLGPAHRHGRRTRLDGGLVSTGTGCGLTDRHACREESGDGQSGYPLLSVERSHSVAPLPWGTGPAFLPSGQNYVSGKSTRVMPTRE